MADTPQRANAAQLAARNIKAKPTLRRKTPLRSDNFAASTPSFAPNPSQGGGLFGGGIQAPTTFNFSTSFQAPSFGGSNPFASNNSSDNEDPRADTTGEEAARRNKSFRADGVGSNETQNQSNPFQFSSSQPASSGNLFGSTNPSSSNLFSFGQNSTQSPATGMGFNPTPSQNNQTNNMFSFGSNQSQSSQASNNISFGAGSADNKPSNNLFSGFGQPTAQPATSQPTPSASFTFGQSTSQPATSQPPASASFTFGSSTPQPKPPSSPFSFNAGGETPKPTPSLFGASTPSANPFATSQSQPAATSANLFGSFNQQSTSGPTPQDIAPSNPFGGHQQDKPSNPTNIFGEQSQQTNNLFGAKEGDSSASNIFGGLKPGSNVSNNIFGGASNTQTASSPFSQTSQPEPPTSMDISPKNPAKSTANNIFGNLNQPAKPATNIFANLNKPVDQKVEQANSNTGDGLAGSGNATQQSSTRDFKFGQSSSGSPFGGFKVQQGTQADPAASQSSGAEPTPKPSSGIKQPTAASTNGTNLFSSFKPVEESAAIERPTSGSIFRDTSKLQKSETAPIPTTAKQPAEAPAAMPMTPMSHATNGVIARTEPKDSIVTTYSEITAAGDISDEEISHHVPAGFTDSQKREFYAGYRLRCLNKAMQKFFGQLPVGADISSVLAFYNEKREDILSRSGVPFKASKRKSFDDDDQENENPNKRPKPAPTSAARSQSAKQPAPSPQKPVSNGTGSQARSTSPVKSQPQVNGATGSTTSLFPVPQLQQPGTTSAASPSPKGKRKAEYQLTDRDPTGEMEERRAKMTKSNANAGSPGGSETMKRFKNIVDTPGASDSNSSQRPTFSLNKAEKDDQPRPNPFAALSVPAKPAPTSKPAANASDSTPADTSSQATSNIFAPKPTAPAALKVPTFGAGSGAVNFLAQFQAKASQDTEDAEQKLMEKAKAEDMDSDEDEAEWEAKYKEKRKAELKEIEELGKSKKATFVAGKGFNFGQGNKAPDTSTAKDAADEQSQITKPTPSKPLFGQSSDQQSMGNSIFGSSGSRTSTPGPTPSRPGSVLDLHTPGKPVSFGANIFGHLSDADSGAESGKGNEADEESDGDSGSSDVGRDSEKKDSKDRPEQTENKETGSGTSAKEVSGPNLSGGDAKFGTVASAAVSGTSSPGGSLFDRISKDRNGNPIRHVPAEEKENAKPTSNLFGGQSNIFGGLNKTPGTPTDKTWKADSPIKFGNSQETPFKFGSPGSTNGAPTVSVTAATPTKSANPFGGLFGSTTPKSTPNPNPFGTVGFAFGAASSTASSLLPSAAASGNTSRATTPGGTTDGESANDTNDADTEHHEQIDLTKGGAGEENEDILHEVRAKALKYVPKGDGEGSPWETKGLGPLRILKHKETKHTRILLRADPSGKIVLNKSILGNVEYKASGKTLKLLTAGDSGSTLETWILQLKTPELAESLAKALEANKASS